MRTIEIVLLSALTLIGVLTATLPSWPLPQSRTIARVQPAAPPQQGSYLNVEYFEPNPTGFRDPSSDPSFVADGLSHGGSGVQLRVNAYRPTTRPTVPQEL